MKIFQEKDETGAFLLLLGFISLFFLYLIFPLYVDYTLIITHILVSHSCIFLYRQIFFILHSVN